MDDNLDKILELMIQRLDDIDDNLQEHMRRTELLEQLHKDSQDRISVLEEPVKAKRYIKELIFEISKFTGAAIAIISALKYFKII